MASGACLLDLQPRSLGHSLPPHNALCPTLRPGPASLRSCTHGVRRDSPVGGYRSAPVEDVYPPTPRGGRSRPTPKGGAMQLPSVIKYARLLCALSRRRPPCAVPHLPRPFTTAAHSELRVRPHVPPSNLSMHRQRRHHHLALCWYMTSVRNFPLLGPLAIGASFGSDCADRS